MPATSSGRILKTRKVKKGTAHQKNHRWESFTAKISKLSTLDPIRRVRRLDVDAEDISTSTSYLKAGLEKWQERNMSQCFVAFLEEVLPFCDSLPQILHFEDKIMENFTIYIEKGERESMEPLLELMADFAHDLGSRFEKHYPKALQLVITVARTPQDVEVIEWCFTCLAFMFKYLSKLLVSDLRPTYDLMAPLLGKHPQPPHIARFAAEAMSFLVKKAAAPAHREKSLPLLVQHAKGDLESISNTRQFGLYYHGLMTMFAEAIKGNGLNVHTTGPSVLEALFAAYDAGSSTEDEIPPWSNVIGGVLTSIVHHTSSETCKDVLSVVFGQAAASQITFAENRSRDDFQKLLLCSRAIGIVAGVRKGSRVSDWPAVLESLSGLLRSVSNPAAPKACIGVRVWDELVVSLLIAMLYAPIDALIPFISGVMGSMTKDPLANWFLAFCSYLSEADAGRFQSIALPYFQKLFIIAHWSDTDNGDSLCVLLPKMISKGVLSTGKGKDGFSLPRSWQDQIVSKFERLEVSPFPEQASPAVHDRSPITWHDRCLPKYNALLEVLESTVVHPSTNSRIAEILLRKLKLALRPSYSLAPEEANFIVGRGFIAFSKMSQEAEGTDKTLEPLLHAAAPRYARLPNFLEALLAYHASLKPSTPVTEKDMESQIAMTDSESETSQNKLTNALVENLTTDSHRLRLLSLKLLEHIYLTNHGSASEVLSIMLMVEETPLSLQTARLASMHIRKLATLYARQPRGSWLSSAIPSFCFGMLTVKYAQIWEDANVSLKQIAETKNGEEVVARLAFTWLEVASHVEDGLTRNIGQDSSDGLTDFECTNLIKLDQLAKEAALNIWRSRDIMLQRFEEAQVQIPAKPATARTQALRVLAAAPAIAEHRSRILVPMFLSWAGKHAQNDESDEQHGQNLSDWTRRDQKAQLELFAHFTNSKSLYQSGAVHDALLRLLCNGDVEIQKSALKALFTWKNSSIKPYEEHLLNLLDEERFKEEIGVLFQGDSVIQLEHREALMPILLRLLYGRTISRKGAASGRQGMEARRLTVLRNLSISHIEEFLTIALGDLNGIEVMKNDMLQNPAFDRAVLGVRKQVGFVNMMEGVLKELGTKVTGFTRKVLDAVLYCVISASRKLQDSTNMVEEDANTTSQASLLKTVRQTGLKCLVLLFESSPDFEWSPYVGPIISIILLPRLENLPIETAQGISVILRLFSVWSSSYQTAMFLGSHDQILTKIAECLGPQSSKDEVKLFALNIIKNVVRLAAGSAEGETSSEISERLLTPNMDHFLVQISGVLRCQHDVSKDLLEGCVETVSELAPLVSTSTQARNLVDISIFLLDQPSRRVSPKTKGNLLLVLENFVPLYDLQNDPSLKDRLYSTVTSLFGFFKDKSSREVLSRVLKIYSDSDSVIGEVAELCVDLNSYKEGRLDEPDYDRRLKAFNAINGSRELSFTARQWTPLLYNTLFYVRHDEEFGILSSNSSDSICKFVDSAGASKPEAEKAAFMEMLSKILMPAIFSGAREPSEVIRREYLKVLAHLVRTFPTWPEVSDMHRLLGGDDELEASFFNNILTAGKGRQSTALALLTSAAQKRELSSKNVSHFFITLIEHFIFDRAEGNDAHNLAAEVTTVVGILATSLEWPQYRALLRRYIGYVESKQELGKQIIRLLGKVIDSIALAAEELKTIESDDESTKFQSKLAATMPGQAKLSDDLTSNILPPLLDYLHDKDESTVSLRVPVAIIIVRLLKLLPPEKMNERLPAVLTDVCHILRSKAQESRDMTRDTLTKICVLLGPSCFGFVLKELRGALARGYQLHVLSYTMHSILVATTPAYAPGDLDYCLPSIVAIIMDDIFGATGQEKDAEEYVSKMKEVKSSKSYDSMELIATTATLSRLTDLVRPIQVLLKEKLDLRMVRKIGELLNRITVGLLRNAGAQSRDSLIFCYEIIQDVYRSEMPQNKPKEDYRLKKYLIQKGASKSGERGTTTIHTQKLVGFAFDVLRAALKKYDHLRTVSNLAGFVPILGDAVVSADEEVKVAALKLLTTIVKVPFKAEMDGISLFRVAVAEATNCISASSTTTSNIVQAALKLISVVLRERRDIPVKDTAVDELLTRLKDDMTEPERRHVTFNFLRAVMDSKVETAMVYDTLDYVGTVMVTNDDKDTRDLARGAYFQFLREYPQKKNRWTKQLGFIVANLKYDREGGRLSILEVIHLLLSKSANDFVQEVAATCFVPLIFVLANDDSEKCRMAAGEVIKEIFAKADEERMNTFLALLRSWITQANNPSVVRLALQAYGFYFEAHSDDDSDVSILQQCILESVQTAEEPDSDWENIYASLQLAAKLVQKFPNLMLASNSGSFWSAIQKCVSYPHAWVKLSAARLIGTYFADFARNNADNELAALPLGGTGGLKLKAEDIADLVRRTANVFKTPSLSQLLAEEAVKNLAFLAYHAAVNNISMRSTQASADSGDEEELEADEPVDKKTALQYLFGRLSFILRRETSPPRAPALIPKIAAMQLLQRLAKKLPKARLSDSLQSLIIPLHNLTDTSIPAPYSTDQLFKSEYEKLKADAEQLMEALKTKVGTTEYSEALLRVREKVKERRMQRSSKRKVEAVSAPERFGEHKRKKLERKKERRKEKGLEHGRKRREM